MGMKYSVGTAELVLSKNLIAPGEILTGSISLNLKPNNGFSLRLRAYRKLAIRIQANKIFLSLFYPNYFSSYPQHEYHFNIHGTFSS